VGWIRRGEWIVYSNSEGEIKLWSINPSLSFVLTSAYPVSISGQGTVTSGFGRVSFLSRVREIVK
jgi:hypothetical protein